MQQNFKTELKPNIHMSAFGIFALILTTAYIIYFAVVISKDIVDSRKKAEANENVETFDIPGDVEAVAVTEIPGGFSIGETGTIAQPAEPVNESEIPQSQIQDEKNPADIDKEIEEESDDTEDNTFMPITVADNVMMSALQGDGTIDGVKVYTKRIPDEAEEPKKTSAVDEKRDCI